jgi:hypothetical protein
MPTVNLPWQDFLSQPLTRQLFEGANVFGSYTDDGADWRYTATQTTSQPIIGDHVTVPNTGGLAPGRVTISPWVPEGESFELPGGEWVMSRETAELLRALSEPNWPDPAIAEPAQVEPPAQRGIRLRE